MPNSFIRDVKEVIRRLRNRGIEFDGNRQYPAIPTIDDTVKSHTNALRAIREAMETHERRNPKAALDSFVRLYELEDVLGGFAPGDANIPWASHEEVDAGAPRYKAVDPETGAYAYDRLRHAGQHAAGKGTAIMTLADNATITIDCARSNVFQVTLGGNRFFANPVNPLDGQVINVLVKQDVIGSRVPTWDTAWDFFAGTPTPDPTASAVDLASCQYDAAAGKWRCAWNSKATSGGGGGGGGGGGLADGDYTDIAVSGTGTTMTINGAAVTYPKIQNVSATQRVLGRVSSGAGVIEELTLTQLLDFIGSAAQGDILYRGATGWARLGAGTTGQLLKTQGAAANPVWSDYKPRMMRGAAFVSGSALVNTVSPVYIHFPRAVTIKSVATVGGTSSGSVVLDIRSQSLGSFSGGPGSSIVASAPPTISAAMSSSDSTLTGWTTSLAADTVLIFSLTSVSGFKSVSCFLYYEES